MRFFNELYPETARQETLLVRMKDDQLPNGDYAFLEYFCDNPTCHCRRVLLDVVLLDDRHPKNSKTIATIEYEWQKPLSKKNPSLNKDAKQSALAKSTLSVFSHLVKSNAFITERFRRHFDMVKNNSQNAAHVAQPQPFQPNFLLKYRNLTIYGFLQVIFRKMTAKKKFLIHQNPLIYEGKNVQRELLPHPQSHQPLPQHKRNDLCPCGSNKKYKKCCLKV